MDFANAATGILEPDKKLSVIVGDTPRSLSRSYILQQLSTTPVAKTVAKCPLTSWIHSFEQDNKMWFKALRLTMLQHR